MINKKVFFEKYRATLDPNKKLDQKEVAAIDMFLDFVSASWKMFTVNQWAYVFATTFHETKYTFEPVREAFWLSEAWRKKNLRYYPLYGRGYVQITWEDNYSYFTNLLGVDFLKFPDLAMVPKYAFQILVHGFANGVFTGKKISTYINSKTTNYVGARKCINGTDDDELIAAYAKLFENILKVAS